jgi:Sulfotransferase domain
MQTAFIHIGFHKTGSTSIQAFLQAHAQTLASSGLAFYQGAHFLDNHVELHVASMRPERDSGFKNRSGILVDKAYRDRAKSSVDEFLSGSPAERIVFSSEGLSLLRFRDEVQVLRQLISVRHVKVIAYLRNPTDYIRSYANQIRKDPKTLPRHIDQDSFAYTEPDTWLLDYEKRLMPFRDVFGSENVIAIDYDEQMSRYGNVIPSFLDAVGLKSQKSLENWQSYFLGRS